jgi:anti-sigma regulatory factor (Ser/Thr protein kinase)
VITAVTDPSQVAEARRMVGEVARRTGLAVQRRDEVAIVVTELATNMLKHGGGGQLHAMASDDAEGTGLELLALDRGPGMSDPGRCMQDGYSTAGSPGTGLGAIGRLADRVRIYTRPGQGCAVLVRFIAPNAGGGGRTLIGAALAPYPGEVVNGDSWSWRDTKAGCTLMLADGSGHGAEAARAAECAVQTFVQHAEATCVAIVQRMHAALAATRGAAVAVARIDTAARVVRFVGVGNIGAVVSEGGRTRHMISHNGTAGHVAPRIREFTYEFAADPVILLHSDGLTSRWDLAAYPGLATQHPSLLAGVLLRDHRRGRDDAAAVAMRAAS